MRNHGGLPLRFCTPVDCPSAASTESSCCIQAEQPLAQVQEGPLKRSCTFIVHAFARHMYKAEGRYSKFVLPGSPQRCSEYRILFSSRPCLDPNFARMTSRVASFSNSRKILTHTEKNHVAHMPRVTVQHCYSWVIRSQWIIASQLCNSTK